MKSKHSPGTGGGEPVTVLVIDDLASNRRAITEMLAAAPDVEVLDRAGDGEEGLKKAASLQPDVITLDLEMPKLDGFAFLRLLMATVPTPVIVISSYAHKSDVFKALELGAFDFIAKPSKLGKDDLDAIREELLEKVRAVRHIRPQRKKDLFKPPRVATPPAPFVVAIGASTGGPPAVQRIVEAIATETNACLLVAQHMPARFTQAFAERLDRIGTFTVAEAKDGDVVAPGHVFIAPGGRHLEVVQGSGRLVLQTAEPKSQDKHAPSVDRLFASVAKTLGGDSLGIVLTGMGADGAEGARAIKKAGGEVWAEHEDTAVINGMPKEAISTGAVKRVLRLQDIGPALAQVAGKRRK
ncbi:MAG: chemotaxis-specific protein-glutamate methyltransferase CheB [Myxococcaceae bacterium]